MRGFAQTSSQKEGELDTGMGEVKAVMNISGRDMGSGGRWGKGG